MKKVIFFLIIWMLVCGTLTLVIWINSNKNNLKMYNRDIIPQMKNSKVLKQEIGEITNIKNGLFVTIKTIGNNQGELKYKVYTKNKKYHITVVMTMVGKKYVVLKYKFNNKILVENN